MKKYCIIKSKVHLILSFAKFSFVPSPTGFPQQKPVIIGAGHPSFATLPADGEGIQFGSLRKNRHR
jgi:hypothetical protein